MAGNNTRYMVFLLFALTLLYFACCGKLQKPE